MRPQASRHEARIEINPAPRRAAHDDIDCLSRIDVSGFGRVGKHGHEEPSRCESPAPSNVKHHGVLLTASAWRTYGLIAFRPLSTICFGVA